MMFAKNVLLSSLSFASVLMVENWSGAIAQNAKQSERYLSDQEIQSLDQAFQASMREFSADDRRRPLQIDQLKDFVNAWQKIDPSIAPFWGSWAASEGSVVIYPSQNKGKVCVLLPVYNGATVQNVFNVGTVSGDKLLITGEIGKSVIVKKRGTLRSGREIDSLAMFSVFDGANGVWGLTFPRPLTEINDNRLARFGCTSSLPSNNQTQISTKTEVNVLDNALTPQQRDLLDSTDIKVFVPSYIPNGFQVHEVKTYRGSIARGYGIIYRDKTRDICFAIESTTGGIGGRLGGEYAYIYPISTRLFGNTSVIFTNYSFLDMRRQNIPSEEQKRSPQPYLGTEWARNTSVSSSFYRLIGADFVGQSYYGAKINQPAEICRNDITPLEAEKIVKSLRYIDDLSVSVTSASSSSTPVKQTDTIAKYPTNEDFNAFEDKLQGNPESLVKLRGNQAEQRRKFQNDWQDRNPNASKFLGAWYTGDRYFYVFPSTLKAGTCVVTQDANGKLNMQTGSVLNKELRYGGDKGFFWRDRPNIIASRDSGSGSLYPIYATSASPELSENMIGDMERQNCITTLPFEADAQYYKERGDKFRKLGKKDEAIANYRKALEIFRKQNLFAQIKTIESLLATLGDKPTTKPITQKPADTIYSGVSPLYEDVKDPAYGLGNLYGLTGMTETFRVGLNAFEVVDNGQTVNLNSRVKAKVPTIIITHGFNSELTSRDFRNLLKAARYNSSVQVLVVDWSQGSKTGARLGLAAARIEASANKVVDLIQKYQLDPNNVSLIGHSLGAHLSVDVALEVQKRNLGNIKSITLLDPAVDIGAGDYKVKDLSKISQSTFIRAFYTSAGGSSSFAASANESYNIKFPAQTIRLPINDAHGESVTLLANSFQGDSNGKRNCIADQFIKLDQKFPDIPQNDARKRGLSGFSKPLWNLNVEYDKNGWLYPTKISRDSFSVIPESGTCKVIGDFQRTFETIFNLL